MSFIDGAGFTMALVPGAQLGQSASPKECPISWTMTSCKAIILVMAVFRVVVAVALADDPAVPPVVPLSVEPRAPLLTW